MGAPLGVDGACVDAVVWAGACGGWALEIWGRVDAEGGAEGLEGGVWVEGGFEVGGGGHGGWGGNCVGAGYRWN